MTIYSTDHPERTAEFTPPAEDARAQGAPVRVDHVRSHTSRCYWDFLECRWECPRD